MENIKLSRRVYMLACAALSGCSYGVPHPSSMNFDAQSMEYVGPVRAEAGQNFLLCAIPLESRDTITDALTVAAKHVGADAVVNVVAETESGIMLGLYCWHRTTATGVGIRFKESALPRLPGEQAH